MISYRNKNIDNEKYINIINHKILQIINTERKSNKMNLKWYLGDSERRKIAIDNLKNLKKDFISADNINKLFDYYIKELEEKNLPTSSILNQFNLSLSNYLLSNDIQLNKEQSQKISELQSLSNIRYGYKI